MSSYALAIIVAPVTIVCRNLFLFVPFFFKYFINVVTLPKDPIVDQETGWIGVYDQLQYDNGRLVIGVSVLKILNFL